MRIECFTGPVVTEVMGTIYRFDVQEDGRAIAEVDNPRHIASFLAVVDHYRDADAEIPPVEPGEAPTLASIDPTTAVLNDPDVTLHCYGTGFTADSIINFAGQPEPIVFVSDTEITTVVKPSLGWGAVSVPVFVSNSAGDSAPLDFTFTEAEAGVEIATTEITGIGPAMQTRLAEAGITDARQIAALTPEEAQKLDDDLGLGGRIARDGWVEQAKALTG